MDFRSTDATFISEIIVARQTMTMVQTSLVFINTWRLLFFSAVAAPRSGKAVFICIFYGCSRSSHMFLYNIRQWSGTCCLSIPIPPYDSIRTLASNQHYYSNRSFVEYWLWWRALGFNVQHKTIIFNSCRCVVRSNCIHVANSHYFANKLYVWGCDTLKMGTFVVSTPRFRRVDRWW